MIECKTYRWYGHYIGDSAPYRTKEELEEWKAKDPIVNARKVLLSEGVTEAELDAIDKAAEEEIQEAVKFAAESPFPANESALEDVYTDIIEEGR